MKKKVFTLVALLSVFAFTSNAETPDNILGNLLNKAKSAVTGTTSSSSTTTTTTSSSSSTGSSALSGLLNLVVGSTSMSESDIVGTWTYSQPACAFASENLLAKAGGAVAAEKVNAKLLPAYNKVGIKSSNTYFTFDSDKNFSGKLKGVPLKGTYTFDASAGTLKLKCTLLSLTAYLTRTTTGMSFTFESKKLLTLLKTVSSLSNNSTVKAVGNLSTNYSGVRVGFDMTKSN